MKKITALILLLLLILAIPSCLLLNGTIDSSSINMLLNVATGRGVDTPEKDILKSRFKLPEGFSINLYAADLPNARFLRATNKGDLLVSRPHIGDVILLTKPVNDPQQMAERQVLIKGLQKPHGLELHQGWLYIAESNAVGRIRFNSDTATLEGEYQHIITGLSDNGNHWSKTLRIGPDEKLYLSQGSTCNVCIEEDSRRATISRYQLDGSGGEIYASGLRNSVGLDWAPWNNTLYATENARDMLGDNFPPDELNQIEQDHFYGWPWFHGNNIADPDMQPPANQSSAAAQAPAHEFRAHNAPLGMTFLKPGLIPGFEKTALVALHGSWNRSSPDGYKVVSLHWQQQKIVEKPFLTGFEVEGDIIGRPADVTQGPDGTIYISDDYAGAIYRVVYRP